jgi:hypothetical protein
MKNLFLLALLFQVLNTHAQAPVAAIEFSETNVLFRGYPNRVLPAVSNNDSGELILAGVNVSIEKEENSEYFIVKPSRERMAKLFVILKKNDILDTIKTVECRVLNLPRPSIFWGQAESGETANIKETSLRVGFPESLPLSANFQIESWQMIAQNDTISGKGNTLIAAEEFLKNITTESKIEIEAMVMGADGKIRKMKGSWVVGPWKEE